MNPKPQTTEDMTVWPTSVDITKVRLITSDYPGDRIVEYIQQLIDNRLSEFAEKIRAALPKRAIQTQPTFMTTEPWPPINEVEAYNACLDQVNEVLDQLLQVETKHE